MSQTVITTAFEQLKAQQAANGGVLTLDEFVFANIPNLSITDPIDRAESWPAANQIVYRQAVSKTGMVNTNAVVYSVVLGADVGDFEFNWVGLINKASNTVAMIVHAPLQKKIKTASGQQGNVLTRSFLMEYDGASQQTQIITPVDTWQIDFTARLSGVDERQRKENMDLYGVAGFLDDGWKVSRNGNKYTVNQGVGYVYGLRAELLVNQEITVSKKPSKVWLDVCWRGTLTSAWASVCKITVASDLANYNDKGEQHYVFAIAEIDVNGVVTDTRPLGSKATRKFDDLPGLYLSRKAPFSDIRADGQPAVAEAISNLGLGDGNYVGRFLGVRMITSSEHYIPSPGCKKHFFEVCAAGGGGGAALATGAGQSSIGGGGFSGDYIRTPLLDAQPYDITIGAGGVGGNGTSSATTGGATTVGNIVYARGGVGGAVGAATAMGYTSNTGAPPVGTIKAPLDSVIVPTTLGIRGFVVNPGTPSGQVAGTGGSTPLGRGAEGQQAAAGNSAPSNSYGAGGAGASNTASGAVKAGGDGAPGVVLVWELA